MIASNSPSWMQGATRTESHAINTAPTKWVCQEKCVSNLNITKK